MCAPAFVKAGARCICGYEIMENSKHIRCPYIPEKCEYRPCLQTHIFCFGESPSPSYSKEPLNNSLCPVPTRCISRNLHLVKVISVQNGHYFSAFLLLFLKKGRLPPYQVAESFRPAMASAYKLAQANIAYSRFSFFFKPRYTVFL